jgi:hypothetical protein
LESLFSFSLTSVLIDTIFWFILSNSSIVVTSAVNRKNEFCFIFNIT